MSMPRERDDESGQFTATVTDDEITDLLAAESGAGTGEVADAFDIQQASAYRRLKRLENAGRVESRKIGGSMLWTATDGEGSAADTPDREGSQQAAAGASDEQTSLGALGLDDQQTAAVAAMRDYLRDHGEAQKSGFTADVYPKHPAGYDGEDGWWNALGTGGTTVDSKGALADLPGVEKPERGAKWRWVGEESG